MCRALAIDEYSYGMEHPNVAAGLNNLATLLHVSTHLHLSDRAAKPMV
jgi:hypothetical protein